MTVLDSLKAQLPGNPLYFHGALHYLDVPQVNSTFSCNATVPDDGFSRLLISVTIPCRDKKNEKDVWDFEGAVCEIDPVAGSYWPASDLSLIQSITLTGDKKAAFTDKDKK